MMKYIHIYFNSIIRRESREEKLENQYDGRSKILWPMSQNVYWFIGIGHLSRHRQTHWIRDGLEGQLHPKSWHCQNWVDPGLEEELWDNLYEILQEWGVLWHFKLDYNGTKMFQPFFCWWWWGSLSYQHIIKCKSSSKVTFLTFQKEIQNWWRKSALESES